MSDWTDTLDARRAGLVDGFHDANSPIDDEEQLDDESEPDAPPAAKMTAAAKNRAGSSRKRS